MIEVTGISKSFPGVRALRDVSIKFESGTCHALMGENGAGKSTLGKILAGLYAPDAGQILISGSSVRFANPNEASARGIAIVHQELLFCENLSVADNLGLADLPRRGPWIDTGRLNEQARTWLAKIGSNIDPSTRVGQLSVAQQQMVQIAGAVGKGAKVLIFDEPSSSLSLAETARLLDIIRELKTQGVLCIYVSHRIEEIFAVCDTVSVLRDGQHVATKTVSDLDRDQLIRLMVGRGVDETTPPIGSSSDQVGLQVAGLSLSGRVHEVSFTVKKGEILGLAGLVGAGRTETLESIFGLNPLAKGSVAIGERRLSLPGSVHEALAAGVGLVPEDRKRHGLVLGLSEKENVSLPILDRLQKLLWVDRGQERELVQTYHDRMSVKSPSIESVVGGLSGGNQQKVVIAKWLAADCKVLLIDEPTRGVDVGAKAEIHALIREVAAAGTTVVVASSDMPELLALSHRILVLRDGRVVGGLPAGPSEEEVMTLMAGRELAPG